MEILHQKPQGAHMQDALKVYFCCHPKDFHDYFHTLSDTILAAQNCVIYYADPDTARTPEFLELLSGMQLFVIPVTHRLLHEETAAAQTEYPFAQEQHIPVLPIVMDSSLYAEFNRAFTHKHSLLLYDEDFFTKLEAFLYTMTVDAQVLDSIKQSFEASIFLSYRKKDRMDAKELIRCVRQNEFCRDVAIWFDDYLTPGENFDSAIKNEILSCDLFLLAMTPNVLEDPNYVADHEIPTARENHLPILAAELVSADFDPLYRRFGDLPATTNVHDETVFAEALQNALKKVSPTKRNSDPHHCYLIGLAYLIGYRVEGNPLVAESLFLQAAESGHEQAINKLIEIYSYGIGVEQDYQKAVFWKSLLSDKIRDRMRESVRHIQKLQADAAENPGISITVRHEYDRAIRMTASSLAGTVSAWRKEQLELASLAQQGGDFAKAKEILQKAICYIDRIRPYLDTPLITVLNTLYAEDLDLYVALANCLMESGDLSGAQQCLQELRDKILQSTETENNKKLSLIRVDLEYAKLLYQLRHYAEADKAANALIENNMSILFPQLDASNFLAHYPTMKLRYRLLRDYGMLSGRINIALSNFYDARQGFVLSISANEKMEDDQDWNKHFSCEFGIIEVYCAMKDRQQAQEKLDAVALLLNEGFSQAKQYHAWCAKLQALQAKIQTL